MLLPPPPGTCSHQSCEDCLSCPLPPQSEYSLYCLLLVTKMSQMAKKRKEATQLSQASILSMCRPAQLWGSGTVEYKLGLGWKKSKAKRGSSEKGNIIQFLSVSLHRSCLQLYARQMRSWFLRSSKGRPHHGALPYKKFKISAHLQFILYRQTPFQKWSISLLPHTPNSNLRPFPIYYPLAPYFIYVIPALIPCSIYLSTYLSIWHLSIYIYQNSPIQMGLYV